MRPSVLLWLSAALVQTTQGSPLSGHADDVLSSTSQEHHREPASRTPSPSANVTVRRYQLAEPSNGTFATESDNGWVNETVVMVPQRTALVSA